MIALISCLNVGRVLSLTKRPLRLILLSLSLSSNIFIYFEKILIEIYGLTFSTVVFASASSSVSPANSTALVISALSANEMNFITLLSRLIAFLNVFSQYSSDLLR